MKMRLALLLSVGCLFAYNEAYANAVCNIVPSCESLGYSKKESDCAEDVMLKLKCPFDNSMVYCPEDCKNYPLASVSYKKGTYVKCATANRYKYTACNDGYDLLDGDCVQAPCDRNIYIYTLKPDETKGEIISCTTGKDTRYGYSSCNEGWELDGAHCVEKDCGPDYIFFDGLECPENADCTEKCMSGVSEKTKITCNDGLVLQNTRYAFICSRYEIGSIYEYNGVPIGIVFSDDGNTTKIVALQDINASGQEAIYGNYIYWSTSSSGAYSYDVDTLTNYSVVADAFQDMDGKTNTQKILAYVQANDYMAEAATATSLYAPSVCPDGSICGVGEWYLPALGELEAIFNKLNTIQTKITTAGGRQISDGDYWSSTEKDERNAWYRNFKYASYVWGNPKYQTRYVRPVLAINKSSLEE